MSTRSLRGKFEMTERVKFQQRVLDALQGSPSRVPVILGGCSSGRTSLLHMIRGREGEAAQYVDVERCATTPERFLQAITASSPFVWSRPDTDPDTPRGAFKTLLTFFHTARTREGGHCTFLLDEVLELRIFGSFPGLRHILRDLLESLATSPNRFVLTTRYVSRAHRLLRDAAPRFEVMHVTPLIPSDVISILAPVFNNYEQMATDDRDYLGRSVQALTDGRVGHVGAICDALETMDSRSRDPISALTALMAPEGALEHQCRYCYEMRLQRARGYGALKAILEILAEEESLTLTEISLRLHRTPGSTRDYLSWLEDVDLIASRQKRYSFTDPLLRLWVHLHCRPEPPTEEMVATEVQRYAAERVPERSTLVAYAGVEATAEERKNWGIIEID